MQDTRVKVVTIRPEHSNVNHANWRKICVVEESVGFLVGPDGIVAWRGELEGHYSKVVDSPH